MNACLYIGLGGTGLKILSKIKARLEKEGVSRPQDVAYLGVDIGAADVPYNLNQNEIISLDGGEVENIIQTDLYWNLVQDWWFNREFAPKFSFSQGAWQLRLLGRLALFYNGNQLVNRISNVLQVLEGDGIEIFVISSVAGGTGSGLFRDFPGILEQVPNLHPNHSFYGFLINHDIVNNFNITDPISKERSKHNAVSLFAELDSGVLNNNQLTMNIRNQNNVAQPLQINSSESFRWIFLQSYNNEDGSNMDTIDDYYELASLLLKHTYFISNNHIQGNSWSGIENSIGAMLVGIKNPISWSIKTKSGKIVNYKLPIENVRQYVGFGGFILEFPEGEVQEYLVNLLLSEVFEELNNSTVEANDLQMHKNSLLNKIQESQNKDILLLVAERQAVQSAHEIGKNIFKSTKEQLKENIKKHLLSSESLETYLNALISDLNLVLSSLSDSFTPRLNKIYSDCITEINESIIDNKSYNLKQKLILIESLTDLIKFESTDYNSTEVAWSKKINEDVARSQLYNEVNSYNSYVKNLSGFEKFFKKNEIEQSRVNYIDKIAKSFVYTYYRSLLLNISNQPILNIYYSLINFLQAAKQKIQTEIDEFSKYMDSLNFYFPDDLQNIITSSGAIDFHIKIAKSKSLLNKYVYMPQKEKAFLGIKNNGVINFDSFNSLKNIIENNTREILQGYTLDEALKMEANYFLNDLPIIIDTGTSKGIVEFKNVVEFARNSTQQELKIYFGKYSSYYDRNSLQNIIDFLASKNLNTGLLNKCINELIKGRLALILNRWRSVFNSFMSIPFLNSPQQYVACRFDNNNNQIINGLFNNAFRNIQTTIIPSTSRTRLDLVNFKVGFSLMQISQYFPGLREQEINRTQTNFKYFNRKEFDNPDFSKIYHSDKRYLEQIELMNYSPIYSISNDKILNIWGIILLFLSLEYVSKIEKNFIKILYDEDGQRIFDKGTSFAEFKELYKLLFLLKDNDIFSLKEKLEKEFKDKPGDKITMDDSLDYFKDNSLCPELDQIITEYGNSLC